MSLHAKVAATCHLQCWQNDRDLDVDAVQVLLFVLILAHFQGMHVEEVDFLVKDLKVNKRILCACL